MNSTGEPLGDDREATALRELALLEALAQNPEAKQADLATRLGVAVGTVNWLVKRLAAKGFLKVKRIGRWRWSYLVTPQGLARKAHLTREYVRISMDLYRATREQARQALQAVRAAGYTAVRLDADSSNDLADVCRLTCLEAGIEVAARPPRSRMDLPKLEISGRQVGVEWPEGERAP